MCEYTQREYGCGHFKFIAAEWCQVYAQTHRRCAPNVTHFEYRANELCSACRPQELPPWENLIRRPNRPQTNFAN